MSLDRPPTQMRIRLTVSRLHGRNRRRGAMSRVAVTAVCAFLTIGLAAGWLALTNARATAHKSRCMENLRHIGSAMQQYLDQNDSRWPFIAKLPSIDAHEPAWPGMENVLTPFLSTTPEALHCPADSRTLKADDPLAAQFSTSTTWFATEGTSYEWMFGDMLSGQIAGKEKDGKRPAMNVARSDLPIMTDFEPFHGGKDDPGAFNSLFSDLVVRSSDHQRSRRRTP